MSRFKVEQICFELGDQAKSTMFKANPEAFISRFKLTESERQAILAGDIGAIYKMGVVTQAIICLSRTFGYDTVTHVSKLRAAAGLPVNEKQIAILKQR